MPAIRNKQELAVAYQGLLQAVGKGEVSVAEAPQILLILERIKETLPFLRDPSRKTPEAASQEAWKGLEHPEDLDADPLDLDDLDDNVCFLG